MNALGLPNEHNGRIKRLGSETLYWSESSPKALKQQQHETIWRLHGGQGFANLSRAYLKIECCRSQHEAGICEQKQDTHQQTYKMALSTLGNSKEIQPQVSQHQEANACLLQLEGVWPLPFSSMNNLTEACNLGMVHPATD